MEDTIKANVGYKVKCFTCSLNDNGDNVLVMDGIHALFTAKLRVMEDYIDECENGNNECAEKYEVFTTEKGNQYIWWVDNETGDDFITKVVA